MKKSILVDLPEAKEKFFQLTTLLTIDNYLFYILISLIVGYDERQNWTFSFFKVITSFDSTPVEA